jgi:hypothetical protein
MPSSNTMLAHEPSQVPENCAIGGKQGRKEELAWTLRPYVRHDCAAGDGASNSFRRAC